MLQLSALKYILRLRKSISLLLMPSGIRERYLPCYHVICRQQCSQRLHFNSQRQPVTMPQEDLNCL